MVALFRDNNKTNDDGDGKKNGKNKMFILTNNNLTTLHVHHAVLYISLPSLHHDLPN